MATVAYDIRPEILADFSTERRKAYEAIQRLRIAGFSESNLYDALEDTVDRMSRIEGRKTNQSCDGKFKIEFIGEDAHGRRDHDAFDGEERRTPVLPIETGP